MMSNINKLDLFKLLLKKISKERILIDEVNLTSYAYDASFYTLKPLVVVRPINIEEVQFIIQIARDHKIPITFRTAGTSLSGQAVGNGIIVDIGLSNAWKSYKIHNENNSIRFEPAIIGNQLNQYLKPYHRKIGPDPASINSCMMGGILANNASGMCCGVINNSYHTLKNIKVVLYNGYIFDTFDPNCEEKLKYKQSYIYNKILEIKKNILNNHELTNFIKKKYSIKNTIGYSINAFIDFDRVSDILSHLFIGSEGTLGFIAEAELETIKDGPYKLTGLLCFSNIFDACESIPLLVKLNAVAVELMDRAAIHSIENKPHIPDYLKTLPPEATTLLVEFEFNSINDLEIFKNKSLNLFSSLKIINQPDFTENEEKRNHLWKIRKGLFPSVGAIRDKNTTVIIEDIAFPLEELPYATVDLQKLFKKHNYDNAIIFGHAKDGNLHFVITQAFDHNDLIEQYDNFIKDVVSLVVEKYHGSLKAEHGTGRNMAPFVVKEWGEIAYNIMKEIKTLLDPNNIFNPGVIINKNSNAHIEHLKTIPSFIQNEKNDKNNNFYKNHEIAEKCIECGFCESVCPSRFISSTPRKRIILQREEERSNSFSIKNHNSFKYHFVDTCVKCGLCEIPCPVGINTGNFVKEIMNKKHSKLHNFLANWTVRNFSKVEKFIHFQLKLLKPVSKFFPIDKISFFINQFIKTPVYYKNLFISSNFYKYIKNTNNHNHNYQNIDFYYFPTCLSRVLGEEEEDLFMLIPKISEQLGINLKIIDTTGYCCSQPYESKGLLDAQKSMIQKTTQLLNTLNPDIPIIIDNASCTYAYLKNKEYNQFKIMDSLKWIEYLQNQYPEKFKKIYNKIYLQNLCSIQKLNLTTTANNILNKISNEVVISQTSECCGFAGDRGIFYPEVTKSSTKIIKERISKENYDAFTSNNITCEIGLSHGTEKKFKHILYLIYKSIL